jgi:hypothetical protein
MNPSSNMLGSTTCEYPSLVVVAILKSALQCVPLTRIFPGVVALQLLRRSDRIR